jgi:hypothetical protein
MEPIASYSTHSIEWRNTFLLFSDVLVLQYSRGLFGPRDTERFQLTTLEPDYVRIKSRRSVFIKPGGLITLFSLLLCFKFAKTHDFSWPLLIVVLLFVFGIALIRTGFKTIEIAQFQLPHGVVRIPNYRNSRKEFEAFVENLVRQIRVARGTA